MKRDDLSTLRPWTARPERDGDESPWEVVAPRRYSDDREQLVASLMSEEDARTVALAHPAIDLVQRVCEGADLEEIQRTARSIMKAYEQRLCRCVICGHTLPEEDSYGYDGGDAHSQCILLQEAGQ